MFLPDFSYTVSVYAMNKFKGHRSRAILCQAQIVFNRLDG